MFLITHYFPPSARTLIQSMDTRRHRKILVPGNQYDIYCKSTDVFVSSLSGAASSNILATFFHVEDQWIVC
jgi:hypothetical protein